MAIVIGVPVAAGPGERRVSLVPDIVKRLTDRGIGVVVEPAAAGSWSGA